MRSVWGLGLLALATALGCGGIASSADPECVNGTCPVGAGTGGSPATGGVTNTGGWSSGSGGGLDTAGTAGTGGSGRLCLNGEVKGGACTVEGSVCARTCGPKSVGWKTETCAAGTLIEGACNYDPGDYSCFQIPSLLYECDPNGPVQASSPCTIPDCEVCGPNYLDSAGNAKVGYCVCNTFAISANWSCAPASAWPPQYGGTGGSLGTGGSGGRPPACLNGETKGGQCTVYTPEGSSCYRTCGPKSVGWKPETCVGGIFVEGSCVFDAYADYSCFVLPAVLPACDSYAVAKASDPCNVLDCEPCGPDYLDSSGNAKVGYCVCNGGDGVNLGSWSCAPASAWPPQ